MPRNHVTNEPQSAAPTVTEQVEEVIQLAQDLVLAAQAIEARVSALNADAAPSSLRDAVVLIKASAAHMVAMLIGLAAQSERLTARPSSLPRGSH